MNEPSPLSSFKQLYCGENAIFSDPLIGFRAVPHDSQMNKSNDGFKSLDGGRNSQGNANSQKLFDGLARDSDDEFMENIKANKLSQREETSPFSIDREISLIPRKRLAEQPRESAQLEAGVERDDENKKSEAQSSMISKYEDLKVVKLNIVMNQKKFWLQSERRIINASPIFCAPNDEIDMRNWTVKVKVNDGTFGDVVMFVDKELLNALLGYNFTHLKKAIAEKSDDELEQCRERAQNIKKVFGRLDLILEVEFSPKPSSYPIIKKIKNLAKS
uniref:RecQ-mediated genome instability protein 1 C-terminal OB-fold domain-containing protein n=1 Tax=Panagrolaimus sp. ES5 TaxID=591445 RepID=A0AC34GCP8_9BILA